jgi:hypothetical protein
MSESRVWLGLDADFHLWEVPQSVRKRLNAFTNSLEDESRVASLIQILPRQSDPATSAALMSISSFTRSNPPFMAMGETDEARVRTLIMSGYVMTRVALGNDQEPVRLSASMGFLDATEEIARRVCGLRLDVLVKLLPATTALLGFEIASATSLDVEAVLDEDLTAAYKVGVLFAGAAIALVEQSLLDEQLPPVSFGEPNRSGPDYAAQLREIENDFLRQISGSVPKANGSIPPNPFSDSLVSTARSIAFPNRPDMQAMMAIGHFSFIKRERALGVRRRAIFPDAEAVPILNGYLIAWRLWTQTEIEVSALNQRRPADRQYGQVEAMMNLIETALRSVETGLSEVQLARGLRLISGSITDGSRPDFVSYDFLRGLMPAIPRASSNPVIQTARIRALGDALHAYWMAFSLQIH